MAMSVDCLVQANHTMRYTVAEVRIEAWER